MPSRNIRLTIMGAIVGAVLGGAAAWAISRMQEQKQASELGTGRELSLATDARNYVGLAVSLIAVVRQVVDLFSPS